METQDSVWADTEFGSINVFNATGIVKFIKNSKADILAHKPDQKKPDWYMDQLVASRLISKYGDKHGWDTVRLRHKQNSPSGRVDRGNLRDFSFDAKVEDTLKTPFRDSHICRSIWDNKCFWKLHEMLKPRLSSYNLKKVVDYRSKMVQILIENPNLGIGRERSAVTSQEALRIEDKEKYGFDIREEWSPHYPRKFPDNYKPKYVDWAKETVFKRSLESKTGFQYYVVPTMEKYNLTESLPKFFKCKTCTEIKIRK